MPITLHCQICDVPFQVEPSRKHTALFGSNPCKRIARRSTITLECQQCHLSFVVKAYRKDTASFCSRACKHQAMLLAPEYDTCTECHQSFLVGRGQRANKGERFCSRKCATVHDGRRKRGRALRNFWPRVRVCSHGPDCPFCCHPWIGTLDTNGYGKIWVNHKQVYTHRAAWELHNERTLPDGMEASHYCHRRACTNMWHIRPATHKENMQDSVRDKRHAFGERSGRAKLTEAQALEALTMRDAGWSLRGIARHFLVTNGTIDALYAGRSWKHLHSL